MHRLLHLISLHSQRPSWSCSCLCAETLLCQHVALGILKLLSPCICWHVPFHVWRRLPEEPVACFEQALFVGVCGPPDQACQNGRSKPAASLVQYQHRFGFSSARPRLESCSCKFKSGGFAKKCNQQWGGRMIIQISNLDYRFLFQIFKISLLLYYLAHYGKNHFSMTIMKKPSRFSLLKTNNILLLLVLLAWLFRIQAPPFLQTSNPILNEDHVRLNKER